MALRTSGDWGTRASEINAWRRDTLNLEVKRFRAGAKDLRALAYSPDGRYLYAASDPLLLRFDVEKNGTVDLQREGGQRFRFSVNARTGHFGVSVGVGFERELEPLAEREFSQGLHNPTFLPDGLFLAGAAVMQRHCLGVRVGTQAVWSARSREARGGFDRQKMQIPACQRPETL